MTKTAERALIISFVLTVCVLLIGITLVTADESVKSVIAKEDDLLGKYEKSNKIFKRYEISDMTIYWHQRMIDDAIVEFDYIRYEFDKNTKEFIEKEVHWREDLPEHLPSIISSEQAESTIRGEVLPTELYYISPESNVFPIKPTPKNPCWIVRSIDDTIIIDAVEGKILGYGVPPPSGFSLSGPQNHTPCRDVWTDWYQSAENWFNTMGYPTEAVEWPTEEKVRSHIQSKETAMFYELAHGGSTSFASGCSGGTDYEFTLANEVENWITGYTKMPFTFIGSCGGMCNVGPNTLSYAFRKGSSEDTVTVGYCGMETLWCKYFCWGYSVRWQDTLFRYMNQGDTVGEAFVWAMVKYPTCLSCMQIAGDEEFTSVPVVKRCYMIDITIPTQSSPASAGAYDYPSHIDDVTVVVEEGTAPVTGLTNADFSFEIGDKPAAASLTDDSTPGKYVFDVTPPHQDAAGKYDFEVTLNYKDRTFRDKEENAVIYTKGAHADVMLIIDRSGSMAWPSSKIEDAKTSAKLFVDYMRDDDYAGVVSFASSASYNYHLTPLTAAIKIAIKNAIDSIYASGMTAMGEGLRYGLNDLTSLGATDHSWAMVLLSDGYQNQGEHPDNVLPDIKVWDIRVFTIGLGDDVDKALLEHIATETGGEYYYAATSDQLREIYELIVGRVVGWQTILKRYGLIFMGEIKQIFVSIGSSVKEALFSISWGGSDLDLVLYKPDGTKIDPATAATDPKIEYVKEATYAFYRITDPDPGEWTMEITAVDVPSEGEEFTATAKVISSLTIALSTNKDQYNQGEVIKTTVSLTESGSPITGAAVNADITLPDGSTETIILYDDGGHGDIAPNDGVYANYFTNTGQIGTYKIDAAATGTTSSGTSFSRQAETTVEVVAGQSVITLIPDTWNETVNASEKIEKTFNVSDPPTVGEKFIINKDLYAEYNGTHYLIYKESSIGGEPDYILSALPTTGKSLAAPNVSKWVLLTPTSLETPTGDLIDASNIILTPSTVQVPLNGSEKFNVSINIPSDAISGVYSGKIVATAIGGSDCIDLEITVIGKREPGIKLKKTSSPNPVAPGGTVTYTVNYTNSGGMDLTNVTITEKYPKGMTFISADPAPDAGTNNKWTIGTLPAGASGQIVIKLKVPESRDLSFTESGSVTGEGFVMVSKDLSTEQKPYSLKNVVTLSCAELAPVSASAFTTVSGVPGTSLEITEHGSGIYSSDEILNLQTKNKSIKLQKSTEAEYQPTSFNFSDGFAVNFATKWTQDICARNIIMGDAMHKKIKDASYIKDETIAEVGKYRTSMEFESSFYGAAHIGTVSKSAKTSEDYIGAFEITWAGREECRYLFNWSRVPGNDTETDNEKVIQFLVDVLDLGWAENATITKSVDEMSINITDNGNTATITIDENKKTATVKVGGETIYVLEVRIEDDTLNIYDCKLEKMVESVRGIGYVMLDKDLASGQMQVREHGSGLYSSDMNFESGRLDKVTEAEYQPTSFNFSDDFAITFPSLWFQGICAKNIRGGTAIHKKISDAAFMVDDTTATKSSMEFESSFNGSMHIGARTDGTRISEDYIGVFNITELIKIGKAANLSTATPTPDWLPCPFPKPGVSIPPSDSECPSGP